MKELMKEQIKLWFKAHQEKDERVDMLPAVGDITGEEHLRCVIMDGTFNFELLVDMLMERIERLAELEQLFLSMSPESQNFMQAAIEKFLPHRPN
jgi:hypothetical protein